MSIVDAARSSIVAYYDATPAELAALVGRVQQRAGELLGRSFVARPTAQVHATVIGLETPARPSSGPVDPGDRPRRFDPGPLAAHLVGEFSRHPVDVRFGGFRADDVRMTSRGECLHDRSFLVWEGAVVLIGWPVLGSGAPSPLLAGIRRGCEPFGVVHRYDSRPGPGDPDAYLVLGRTGARPGDVTALETVVRRELATSAVRVRMTPDDLSLVEYADPALPLSSTRRRPLRSLAPRPTDG